MENYLIAQFGVTIIAFAEFDGERESYEVLLQGELIRADSLALLISELQARTHLPLLLAA